MSFRKASSRWFVGFGLALLGFSLIASVYSFSRLLSANVRLAHNDDARVALYRLRSAMTEADSGMRGYVRTGDSTSLAAHDKAAHRWREALADVDRLTRDIPEQHAGSRRLGAASATALDGLERVRRARDEARPSRDKLAAVLAAEGRMDAVRATISGMQAEEIRIGRERLAETNRHARLTLMFAGASAFAGLVIVTSLWGQRRAATERQRVETLLDLAHDAILMWDREGRIVYWNRGAEACYGWSADEALGQNVHELLATQFPVPLPDIQAEVDRVGQWSGQLLHLRKNGATANVDSRWARQRTGPYVRTVEIGRDVTARIQAAELERGRTQFLLRAAEELGASLAYEEILATVARLAVPALADWCAVDVLEETAVRRVTTVHGDPEKVALADELNRRYGPHVRAQSVLPDIIGTGRPVLLDDITREALVAAAVDPDHLRLIEKLGLRSYMGVPLTARGKTIGALSFATAESGRRFSESDLAFARSLADRAALAIDNGRLFREVERARVAASLQLAQETHRRHAAEETARFAEMFIGMLGHDLRNPLNAVMMSARLLERRGSADPKTIERILASTSRMSTMVRQLLDLTRSRLAGGIPMEKTEVDMAALVSEVVDEAHRVDPHRAIRWEPPSSIPAEVDHSRVAQVISNLIGNALEHGDPLQPIEVSLAAGEHSLELRVHNQGPPIAPNLLPVIFDPFRRTTAREKGSKGLGLGLFISQQIVLAHGGHIEVSSTPEEGTTFTVHLPRAEPVRTVPAGQGLTA